VIIFLKNGSCTANHAFLAGFSHFAFADYSPLSASLLIFNLDYLAISLMVQFEKLNHWQYQRLAICWRIAGPSPGL
jgi:hypothetical protein